MIYQIIACILFMPCLSVLGTNTSMSIHNGRATINVDGICIEFDGTPRIYATNAHSGAFTFEKKLNTLVISLNHKTEGLLQFSCHLEGSTVISIGLYDTQLESLRASFCGGRATTLLQPKTSQHMDTAHSLTSIIITAPSPSSEPATTTLVASPLAIEQKAADQEAKIGALLTHLAPPTIYRSATGSRITAFGQTSTAAQPYNFFHSAEERKTYVTHGGKRAIGINGGSFYNKQIVADTEFDALLDYYRNRI